MPVDVHRDVLRLRVFLPEPEVGDLGIHVGHPGDVAVVRLRAGQGRRQQDVPHHQPRLVVRRVREPVGTGHVAARVDVAHVRAERAVHGHAAAHVVLHAGRVETEIPHVRGPSGGHQEARSGYRARAAVTSHLRGDVAVRLPAEGFDAAVGDRLDSLGREGFVDNRRGLGVVPGKEPADVREDRDPDPEPAHDLAHLASDGPAPEHDQRFGRRLLLVEERLVREVGRLVDPGNGRDERPRAGGDHEVGALETRSVVEFHRVGADEAGARFEDVHAETLEPLHGIVRSDPGAPLAHVLEDALEPKTRLHRIESVGFRIADALDQFRGGNERLGRHAPVIETIATHLGGLHQRDAPSEPGGAGGGHEPRGARPDDDYVVSALAAFILHATSGTLFRRAGRGSPGDLRVRRACLVVRHPRRGIAGCWASTKRDGVRRSDPWWSPAWRWTR